MLQNLLLNVLPEREHRRIAAHCETVKLQPRTSLCRPDAPVTHAWFPETAVCSTIMHVESGEGVEVGLVGREGMVGLPLVLGGATSAFHVMVQVGGTAVRVARRPFIDIVLAPGQPLCNGLLFYTNLYLANVAQTAACNRLHRIDQRIARWLLDLRDRIDSDLLPITHEFLALMVGAYRPSVTNALKGLEERGVLTIGRGVLEIRDREGLESTSCECHWAIRRRTESTLAKIAQLAAA